VARKLLWVVVFLNALPMCISLLLAGTGLAAWIGIGSRGYDEYAFLNPYFAIAGVAGSATLAILTAPAVLALRWQRAPPASRRSVGAVTLLALATLVNVALGLGWIVAVVFAVLKPGAFAVLGQTEALGSLVEPIVFVLAPNVFALMAAWSWRPWARRAGKPLRWTPQARAPAPPPA